MFFDSHKLKYFFEKNDIRLFSVAIGKESIYHLGKQHVSCFA